jgi:hypothetical protein
MSPYGPGTPLPDENSEEDADRSSSMMGSTTSLPQAVLNVRLVPHDEQVEDATPVPRGRSREISHHSREVTPPEDEAIEPLPQPLSDTPTTPGPSTFKPPKFTLQPTAALSRSWDSD